MFLNCISDSAPFCWILSPFLSARFIQLLSDFAMSALFHVEAPEYSKHRTAQESEKYQLHKEALPHELTIKMRL